MAKKMSFTEKRKKPRAPLEVDATIAVGGESYQTTTTDISVGGLSVLCSSGCESGSQANVSFFLPDGQEQQSMEITYTRSPAS